MRVSLGDVSLWFDVSGPSVVADGDRTVERPVVVGVHGGPGLDHFSVTSALAPLADDFQIVCPDLRGHGAAAGQATTGQVSRARSVVGTSPVSGAGSSLARSSAAGLNACRRPSWRTRIRSVLEPAFSAEPVAV